jgi:chromosome segregation ATPase
MPRNRVFAGGIVLVVLCAAWAAWTPLHAQQASNAEVLPALLTEVRGLRAAMEQMASANAHAQLLVGRLQLQETRMSGMIRRLDTVRDSIASARASYEQLAGALKRFESDKAKSAAGDEDLEGMLRGVRNQAAAAKANLDRLAAEENQLTTDLSAEQSRWVEINQRLDELEKSLKK